MIKNEKIITSYLNKESNNRKYHFRRHYEISNEAVYEHRVIAFVHYDYRYDIDEHA